MKKIILFSFLSLWLSIIGFSQTTYTSAGSGNWNSQNNWTPSVSGGPRTNDHVIILAEHTITANSLTRSGNTTVNGRLNASGKITFNGNGQAIGGSGNISGTDVIELTTGPKIIPADASLTLIVVSVNIIGGITVTNNGTVTIASNLTGSVAGSTWTNGTASTLNIAGALLATGTLNAFASANTINYYGTNTVSIKLPSLSSGHYTYYNLVATGNNNKTLPDAAGASNLAINGDLTIYSTVNGNGGNKVLRVRGNWLNYGNFTEGAGTVIFDGTADQLIVRTSGDEAFNHLTINKPSGKVILNTNVTISTSATASANRSVFTMTSGNIECGSYKLSLGRIDPAIPDLFTGILVWNGGTIVGEFERFINHDWNSARTYVLNELVFHNGGWWKSKTNNNTNNPPAENVNWTTSSILFPIGTSLNHRPAEVFFNQVTPGSLTAKFNSAPTPGNNGMPLSESGVTLYNTFRDGYWSLTSAHALTSTDYNLNLTGDGFTGFTITANTRLLTRSNSSTPWTLNGTHGPLSGSTVKRLHISTISGEYCFGDDTNCAAPADPIIAGPNDICQNTAGNSYSVADTGNDFTWSVSSSGTITSGQGTNQIQVSWGAGQEGTVSVVESNSCTSSALVTLLVRVNPVPPVAIAGRTSVPENGVTPITYSTPAQAGYSHTWSITGGSILTGQGTDVITVSWGAAGTGVVCVNSTNACGTSTNTCLSVSKYVYITSIRSGSWGGNGNQNPWDCSCTPTATDNVIILATHIVSLNNTTSSVKSLTIDAAGVLNTSNPGRTLNVYGDLTISGNGTAGAGAIIGPGIVSMNGGGAILDGLGSINNTGFFNFNSNSSIYPTAILTRTTGQVRIAANTEVINSGSFTLGGNLAETDATSTWTNDDGATLTIGGSLLPGAGVLNASASLSTVHFTGNVTQIIKTPSSNYYHIAFSGTGEKTAPAGTLLVSGDFTNNGTSTTGTWVGFNPNGGTMNFGGSSTILGNSISSFNNLTISGDLTASDLTMQLAGNFVNNGTFNHNNGTVVFNGLSTSGISGTSSPITFNNLSSSNPVGVNVNADVNLIGTLSISAGVFDADGTANTSIFTLKSTNDRPTQDASIGTITGGGSVVGKVTAERYISAQGLINRYISVPMVNATVEELQDDFSVTGPFSGSSFPCLGCKNNGNSLRYYDEAVAGTFEKGYKGYPSASGSKTDILQVGRGYLAFMHQNNNLTLDITGTVNQGTISLPVTYTTSPADVNHDGWNLVGNPYPSSIKWGGISDWSRTNIDPVISVPDLSITSGYPNYYQAYNWVDNSGDPSAGVIAMGQAFWVKANQANPLVSPSLSINESAKTSSGSGNFYRKASPSEQLVIAINNGKFEDKSYLKINHEATEEYDPLFDGHKFKNDFMNVFLVDRSQRDLVMHTIGRISQEMRIPIGIEVKEEGEYTLTFSNLENFSYGTSLYLIDTYEQVAMPVSSGNGYSFKVFDVQNQVTDRFYLSLSDQVQGADNVSIIVYPNPVKDFLYIRTNGSNDEVFMTLYDSSGKMLVTTKCKGESIMDMRNYPAGMFIFKAKTAHGVVFKKIVKND